MLFTSIILVFSFAVLKNKNTTPTDNKILQAIGILLVITCISSMNARFSIYVINPALASAYTLFEVTQYSFPNTSIVSSDLNHYVWAYILAPLVGGLIGGLLFLMHNKYSSEEKDANKTDTSLDMD